MNRIALTLLAGLVLGATGAEARDMGYDPYTSLPGPRQAVDLTLLPATTPDVTELGSLSTTDVAARYSVDGRLEVGARAAFGFLHDGSDAFSSLVLGSRFAPRPGLALTLDLTPHNEAGSFGLALGAVGRRAFTELELAGRLQVGLLEGYAPAGADVQLLLRPSRALRRQVTGYLDVDLATNTDDPGEHLSVLAGPNLAWHLERGWQVNGGVFFSVLSGDLAADTELGLRLAVQRRLPLR